MGDQKDKSLRDMIKQKKVAPDNLTPDQQEQFKRLRDKVSRLEGKDESDLMRELNRLKSDKGVAAKLKGKDLDNFTNTLKPMLNREQQRRLEDIVKQLRKN